MKFLITGGAGFIGSNTSHFLVNQGHGVRIIDNFSSGKKENLDGILNDIELINGDIRDFDLVKKAITGVDYVLHLAALASVPASIENPVLANDINVNGTLNVLEASRLTFVKKVVFASSSAVYGDTKELPIKESVTPRPLSPYAVGKLMGEYYARLYWEHYQLPTVSLRFFNVYGPRQNPDGDYAAVIPKFIQMLLNGKSPKVYGDGEQSRDFIFVDDAVQACFLAATNNEINGTEFNVAYGSRSTLNQLIENLQLIMNTSVNAVHGGIRAGDITHSYADIARFSSYGFKPKVDFKTGLRKTVEYFSETQTAPRAVSKVNR
ncbi:MAG TPA: SDR family oxidoreductase [candidate division Zixibacteria bacterium]|nr:SDR family oxidoreductase [candidate division Zixibacteria bacterium]